MMDWWSPYVGLPFGQGPGQVTCWSLVREVFLMRRGVMLPAHGDIDAQDLLRVARAFATGDQREAWSEVTVPDALDIVAMRSARGGAAVCHAGILVMPDLLLHAEEAAGSCVVPLQHWSIRQRIAGFRRYVG